MITYHKIDTIFERDEKGRIIVGAYSMPAFWYLRDNHWMWYEKLDGTNTRFCLTKKEGGIKIEIRGRTDKATFDPEVLADLTRIQEQIKERVDKVFWKDFNQAVIFGETIGKKIGSAGKQYCSQGHKFYVFDVWIDGRYLKRTDTFRIAGELGLNSVPSVCRATITGILPFFVKEGFKSLVSEEPMLAEGLVGIPLEDLYTRDGRRVITKIKTRDFVEISDKSFEKIE